MRSGWKFSNLQRHEVTGMTTAIVRSNEILDCDMWNDKGSVSITPLKINLEAINHPFRKDNDLPNLHDHVPC